MKNQDPFNWDPEDMIRDIIPIDRVTPVLQFAVLIALFAAGLILIIKS